MPRPIFLMSRAIFSTILVLLAATVVQAQNTNPWPATGSVGIGTGAATPDALLQVKGNVHVGTDLILTRTDGFTGGGSITVDNVVSNTVSIWKTGGGNIDFINLYGSTIGLNGKVAVGGLFPQRKLDITTTDGNDGIRIIHNNSGFAQFFSNSLPQGGYNGLTQAGDAGITYGDWNTPSASTSFGFVITPWSSTTGGLRLDRNGNVGIGTANIGTNKLAVEGNIAARKVIVTANSFADYVFQPDYPLITLDSLHRYVQANHHLPDIPTADSVAKSGLDLGNNQTTLLKKIEELTLYLIAQNKRQEDQQQLLKDQKEEIQALRRELDALKASGHQTVIR